jgi:serine/threonine-protein kinase
MKQTQPPVTEGEMIGGKYRVERLIGAGGMGVVVAAQHLQLGKLVALKFLRKDAWSSREATGRFLREGRALARLTSPHVARVMDVGTLEHGEPYLVMEFLHGSDLSAVLKERGPLPIAEAVGYLLQVCEAVAEAHANGIVHRDLKPSNLFLTRAADGAPLVKVLDFGISKAIVQQGGPAGTLDTSTGALVGSPHYMSPEQIRNAKRVDGRSDVWSLGVILHELLTGELPFRGETVAGTLAAVAADAPTPVRAVRAGIPVELEVTILRCLEKDPNRRHASVAEFAKSIAAYAPVEARPAVARIVRLLEAGALVDTADTGSSPAPADSAGMSATVPAWEGQTEPVRSGPRALRTRLWLGAAVVGAALGIASAFLFVQDPAPSAARTGLSPSAARSGEPNPLASAAPSGSPREAPPQTSPSITWRPASPATWRPASPAGVSSAGPASSVRRPATQTGKRPERPARVATPAPSPPSKAPVEEEDGTADRK